MHKDRKNNKPTNKKKKLVVFFLILLVSVVLVLFALNIGKDDNVESVKKVVDEIENFEYTVSDSDTKLFKDTFKELKTELSKDEVDKEKYASLVAKLFIIDFYTLSNKTSINDVGGVQFVYSTYKSDFIDYARTGMYKQVQSNLDNDRSQNLPEVKSIEIEEIEAVVPSTILESEDFKNATEANAYEIKINWTYTESNDFQDSATMLIVEDGNKLSVAKLK